MPKTKEDKKQKSETTLDMASFPVPTRVTKSPGKAKTSQQSKQKSTLAHANQIRKWPIRERFTRMEYFSEFEVFLLEHQWELPNSDLHGKGGGLILPVFPGKEDPEFRELPIFANWLANRPFLVWFVWASTTKSLLTSHCLATTFNLELPCTWKVVFPSQDGSTLSLVCISQGFQWFAWC